MHSLLLDVEEIVRCHRMKAEEKEGFMEDLRNTFYGFKSSSVLAWSLQDVISGVRVVPPVIASLDSEIASTASGSNDILAPHSGRRCQVRAYIVMVNDAIYLYKVYEVRLPSWDVDLDATLAEEHVLYCDSARASNKSTPLTSHNPSWSSELENEYCGEGHGRPYNEHRNKGCTERYVLSELSELNGSDRSIEECIKRMFSALKPVLISRQRGASGDSNSATQSGTGNKDMGHVFDWDEIVLANQAIVEPTTPKDGILTEVAIVGVDLVLQKHPAEKSEDSTFSARIVEINNNPAMPAAEGKHMSQLYRQHLVDFVASTMQLAMYDNNRLASTGSAELLRGLKFDKI
jgi:hypothetical protein